MAGWWIKMSAAGDPNAGNTTASSGVGAHDTTPPHWSVITHNHYSIAFLLSLCWKEDGEAVYHHRVAWHSYMVLSILGIHSWCCLFLAFIHGAVYPWR